MRLLRPTAFIAGLIGLAGTLLVAAAPVQGHPGSLSSSDHPASLQDPCPGNLLVNSSFEEGSRKTEGLGTSLSSAVAHGWFPWFIRGNQQYNREPEFKVEDATRDPLRWRVHTGYFSQKFFTTWATHTAGVYQRVAVRPGSVVNFSAWVQIYTGEADGWDGEKHHSDRDAPGNYRALIGIDPLGNTPPGAGAPTPDTVTWSAPIMTYDVWTQLSIQAVAQSDHVTVYVRGQPEFAVKHNDSFWDTTCLTVGGTVPGVGIPAGADAVVDAALLNFRAGPGTEYDIIDTLGRGDTLTVEARLADNTWLNVTTDAGTAGWVFTDLLRLGIDLDLVRIAQRIPPTPTPIPTDTPEPSATLLQVLGRTRPQDTASERTPTSVPTDTPAASATPESTQTPVPTAALPRTATLQALARAREPSPTVVQTVVSNPTALNQPQSNRVSRALDCAPALIALGIGLLGLLIWPRRRRGQ